MPWLMHLFTKYNFKDAETLSIDQICHLHKVLNSKEIIKTSSFEKELNSAKHFNYLLPGAELASKRSGEPEEIDARVKELMKKVDPHKNGNVKFTDFMKVVN
jgi:Ca2+-binding EF-hand superfamily protein